LLQSPSFKFSRKASSSYSLKLEPPNKQKFKTKRKPLSTPASPSRAREPQCTCMTAEQYARLRAQDPRYRGEDERSWGCDDEGVVSGSSTLPRAQTRATDTDGRTDKVTAATSSTSLYDNVGATQTGSTQGDVCDKNMLAIGNQSSTGGVPTGVVTRLSVPGTKGTQREGSQTRQMRDRGVQQQSQETSTMTSNTATGPKTVTASVGTQNNVGSQVVQTETQSQTQTTESTKTEGTQAGGTLQMNTKTSSTSTRPPLRDNAHHVLTNTKSVDYSEIDMVREVDLRNAHHHNLLNNNITNRRNKSKSTEDMNRENSMSLDSNTLKRMLKPMPSAESPVTSPEMGRRRYNYYNNHHHRHPNNNGRHSEPESGHPHPRSAMAQNSRFSGSR
jgi:T-lymphoma invasion and metastasis-inducing protein 1